MTEECSYRFVGLVRIWTKIGRFFGPKANMKHLKHPKHLKHLKHLMWMPGLLFCKHFKELGGKVKEGVHRGQDQKVMFLFGRLGGMEENKKSLRESRLR